MINENRTANSFLSDQEVGKSRPKKKFSCRDAYTKKRENNNTIDCAVCRTNSAGAAESEQKRMRRYIFKTKLTEQKNRCCPGAYLEM